MNTTHTEGRWNPIDRYPGSEELFANWGRGYVGPYDNARGYNWQVRPCENFECLVSGSADTAESARAEAERLLRLPIERFVDIFVGKCRAEINGIEELIRRCAPHAAAGTDYQRGFSDGVEWAKGFVLGAMDMMAAAA